MATNFTSTLISSTPSPTKFELTGDESWYIGIRCVPTSLLMPLIIVLFGVVCQALIAFYITFPTTSPSTPKDIEMQQKGHQAAQSSTAIETNVVECGCCVSCKTSRNV